MEIKEKTILTRTNVFKELVKDVKSSLQQLHINKTLNIDLNKEEEIQAFNELYDKNIQKLAEIRMNHRELYIDIEKNKLVSQKEKDILDLKSTYLEALQYQKSNLLSEIDTLRSYQNPVFCQISFSKDRLRLLRDINNMRDLKSFHEETMQMTQEELKVRKDLKEKVERSEEKKKKFMKEYEEKQKFVQKIPAKVNAMSESLKDMFSLFSIHISKHPKQIQLAKLLPPPLFNIYHKFVSLIESKEEENISIIINDISESSIQIPSGDANKKYQMHNLEIELTISNSPDFADRLEKILRRFENKKIEVSGLFPLKFFIRYMTEYNLILIQLYKNNMFFTIDLLKEICEYDSGEAIFSNAKNEYERNLNNKYPLFNWLQRLGGNQPQSIAGRHSIISAERIVRKIRERICSNIVLKIIIEDLKSDKILSLKKLKTIINTELSNDIQRQYSKFKVLECRKVNFQEFKQYMNFPDWLTKKPSPQEIDFSDNLVVNIGKIMAYNLNPNHQQLSKFEINPGNLFSSLGMEDFLFETKGVEYSSFYRLVLEYKEKNKINCLLKIHPDYPNKIPQLFIRQASVENPNSFKKDQPKKETHIKEVPEFLKDKLKTSKNPNSSLTICDLPPRKIFQIEKVINSPTITSVFSDDQKEYLLVYQLHLLMFELAQLYDFQKQDGGVKSDRERTDLRSE